MITGNAGRYYFNYLVLKPKTEFRLNQRWYIWKLVGGTWKRGYLY